MSAWILTLGLLLTTPSWAQPSGGPYGPIHQTYKLPKTAAHIFYVAPDGDANAPGTKLEQPTTIEAAIARVVTGDAIIMRGGVYRTGGLVLNQGITLQPYADERPILKGTQVATKWQALRDNLWRTSWERLFPSKPQGWWRREREGMRTPLHRFNNDMVFVDGEMLQSVGWEGAVDEHSFYIDYDAGHVFIGVDPANRLVEITAWDGALIRTSQPYHGKVSDHKGPLIRGITFTQYAYRALEVEGKRSSLSATDEPTDEPEGLADPSTYGKEVVGTTLEHVTITHCSRVAGYFRGDRLTIRHSLVSDTSTEGIYVIGSSDVLLEKNIFRRNNVEQITGYYASAVKIFNQSYRVTCRDNLVIDNPNSNGIWYDVGNVDSVFVDNRIDGAVDGFFVEISKGAICAGNVITNCVHGIRVLNSSDVRVYNNTLVNAQVSFERNERSAATDYWGWHASTGPDVDARHGHELVGNLLAADRGFDRPLLQVDQRKMLCGRLTQSQLNRIDGNVYVRAGDVAEKTLVMWSPVAGEDCVVNLSSLDALRRIDSALEAHGRYLNLDLGSVFKSPEIGRYELFHALPGAGVIGLLPSEIQQLLGWKKQATRAPGAYPLVP